MGRQSNPFSSFLSGLETGPFQRGEILWMDYPFAECNKSKIRPVVFWGILEEKEPLLIVTYMTSKEKEYARRTEYAVNPDSNILHGRSYVRCNETVALPFEYVASPAAIGRVKPMDLELIQMMTDDCLKRIKKTVKDKSIKDYTDDDYIDLMER